MADFDLLVIGGGPAGYTAALTAAERGATVALAEAERPGGTCVHFACIPTGAMLASADDFLRARGLAALGIVEAGEELRLGAASDRRAAVVRTVADNVAAALAQRKVRILRSRAVLTGPTTVELTGEEGGALSAEAIVVAAGSRWDPPTVPGLAADRLLTADQVFGLRVPPPTALVLGGGTGAAGFALEHAFLLAVAGTAVTLVTPDARLLPDLDLALDDVARAVLADAGVTVMTGAEVAGADGETIRVRRGAETVNVEAGVAVSVERRRPFCEGLGIERAGLPAGGALEVDRGCRTAVSSIFAAGDVTGGAMLSSAALRMGEVAGINATGGETAIAGKPLPRLLHLLPQIGWIGLTEAAARAQGYDVCTGIVDLGYNARAITLGAPLGLVKIVAERELGEILGVHVAGPEASEILAVANAAIHAEMALDDLAASVQWHPSVAESLVDAARRALRR